MNGLRLACVCGQRGSAAGLAPVLQEGGNRGWQIRALAYGEAIITLRLENVESESCDSMFGEDDAIRWLSDADVEVVLLGTDTTRHVEKRVARAANTLGIPSIMFVDFWSNYAARFEDEKGRSVPDAVAVLDAEMASSLETCGIARDRLHITGSPALEQAALLADLDMAHVRSLRAAAGLPADCVCVLFVSSPASVMDYGNEPAAAGRSHSLLPELQNLASAMECCEGLKGRDVCLVVRPHPREDASSFSGIRCGQVEVRVETGRTGLDWVAISDLVVGLDTMLLVEAMIARRPVLCLAYVRPLIPAVRALVESRGGLVDAQEELPAAVARMFSPQPKGSYFDQGSYLRSLTNGATKNMVALVTQVARGRAERVL